MARPRSRFSKAALTARCNAACPAAKPLAERCLWSDIDRLLMTITATPIADARATGLHGFRGLVLTKITREFTRVGLYAKPSSVPARRRDRGRTRDHHRYRAGPPHRRVQDAAPRRHGPGRARPLPAGQRRRRGTIADGCRAAGAIAGTGAPAGCGARI